MNRFLFCLFFLMLSCKESFVSEGPCLAEVEDDYVKSYFDFNEGTRWVYREVNSGTLDSVEVFYHTPRIDSNPVDFYWLASCSHRGYNYFQNYFEDDHGVVNNVIDGCPRNLVYAGYESPTQNSSRRRAFYIGFNRSENLPLDKSFFLEKLDHLEVNGVDYTNVLVYLNTSDGGFDFDSVKYSIAEHYGIVRFENLNSGERWDLVSSEIIK